jgi:hypothetical protein
MTETLLRLQLNYCLFSLEQPEDVHLHLVVRVSLFFDVSFVLHFSSQLRMFESVPHWARKVRRHLGCGILRSRHLDIAKQFMLIGGRSKSHILAASTCPLVESCSFLIVARCYTRPYNISATPSYSSLKVRHLLHTANKSTNGGMSKPLQISGSRGAW